MNNIIFMMMIYEKMLKKSKWVYEMIKYNNRCWTHIAEAILLQILYWNFLSYV